MAGKIDARLIEHVSGIHALVHQVDRDTSKLRFVLDPRPIGGILATIFGVDAGVVVDERGGDAGKCRSLNDLSRVDRNNGGIEALEFGDAVLVIDGGNPHSLDSTVVGTIEAMLFLDHPNVTGTCLANEFEEMVCGGLTERRWPAEQPGSAFHDRTARRTVFADHHQPVEVRREMIDHDVGQRAVGGEQSDDRRFGGVRHPSRLHPRSPHHQASTGHRDAPFEHRQTSKDASLEGRGLQRRVGRRMYVEAK